MRRLCDSIGGTLEHPEELTDRCCLSALAGLSKYLPFLGAGGIIAFRSDMSTSVFTYRYTLDHVYNQRRKVTVTVVHVDWWKRQRLAHKDALERRLWFVE
jgi:hypothetical protein